MKIEYRETKKDGLIQITSLDERFYRRESDGRLFPSSSWISGYTPLTPGLAEFLKREGQNADDYRDERGNIGTRVHNAIDLIMQRKVKEGRGYIDIEAEMFANENEEPSLLNGEECETVLSWVNWWKELESEYIIEVLAFEQAEYNEEFNYAGTVDLRSKFTLRPEAAAERAKHPKKKYKDLSGVWTIDYKTSKGIYQSHEAQLSSYGAFLGYETDRLAFLQVGFKKNQAGYKFTEQVRRFDLFLAAQVFWKDENENKSPRQYELPQFLQI